MASTIIDSLMIELGIDSSKFEEGQKKSVEALRKFDAESQKSSKTFQENNKKSSESVDSTTTAIKNLNATDEDTKKTSQTVKNTGDNFGFLGKFAAGAAVAIGALKVVKDFSLDMIDSNAQLGRMSSLLGETPQQIAAWGTVLKGVGGTADDFTGSMQNIEGSIARLKLGMGGTEILRPLGMLGVSIQDANNPDKIQSALQNFSKAHGQQEALVIAQGLGINFNTFEAMINQRGTLKGQYAAGMASAHVNSAATDEAQKQLEQVAQLSSAKDGLAQINKKLADPAIDKSLDTMIKAANAFNNATPAFQATAAALTDIAVALGAIGAMAIVKSVITKALPKAATVGITATEAAEGAAALTMRARIAALIGRGGASVAESFGLLTEGLGGSAALATGATVAGVTAAGAAGYGIGTGINWGINKFGFDNKASLGTKLYDLTHSDKPTGATSDKQSQLRALEKAQGIPAGSLDALWAIESARGKNKGSSSAGAMGDFQFMPDAAKRFGVTDRNSFDQESVAASKYMKALIAMFHDPAVAAGAYNWGEGNMKAFLKTGKGAFGQSMPSETKNYMKDYNAYMGAGIGANMKGGHAPSTTEVNIQTIQVNAPNATDASGISQSIHGALQKNLLLTQSAIGSN
jgi:hypothetical protein